MRNTKRWLLPVILLAGCTAVLTPVAATADPAISGFNVNHVPLNSYLLIYGSGFGAAQGQSYVLMASRRVPVLAWADDAIQVWVNPGAFDLQPVVLDATYPVQVVNPAAGTKSNLMNLTITSAPPPVYTPSIVNQQTLSDQPSVTGFQATSFEPGDDIAIFGSGFGFTQGSGYVTVTVPFVDSLGNSFTRVTSIPVLNWSENAIDVLLSLPAGAQPGSYTLTVHRGNGKTSTSTITVTTTD